MIRMIYEIEGIVQGVGFRPAVYSLATSSGLGGWVRNCSGKVQLALEGGQKQIDLFMEQLQGKAPAQARIDKITCVKTEQITLLSAFRILESLASGTARVVIPSDMAICKDCAREISDRSNRRFAYPFTTCVNCGPRYTVINSMPYDRCRTTLSAFPLCKDCQDEYADPSNRRFHAESIACPVCGPQLSWHDSNGNRIECQDIPEKFRNEIKNGKIIAIRGIGGFLLAADAFNQDAIIELRLRKKRPHKPFAVMIRDISVAEKFCYLSSVEKNILESPQAPIVILDIRHDMSSALPVSLLSPDTMTLGVMLPYSPMHMLLFDNNIEMLIMTSGNKRGEPVCINNDDAFQRLAGIADAFIVHDREINLRNDDSLCVARLNNLQVWRRARGFAPEPIKLKTRLKKNILAMGAELKNTIAIGYDDEVVLSPHIGDMQTPEAMDGLDTVVQSLPEFLGRQPELVAVDLHPDIHSSILGRQLAEKYKIPYASIQHHFAHAASCMAEHGLDESLALVFDGTGFGYDGTIWGAELLYISPECSLRLASFKPEELPGGDKAVTNPWRQLFARWFHLGFDSSAFFNERYGIEALELSIIKTQLQKKINSPLCHSAGRLFDSFSVALGISPSEITYEGQAAIRLEAEAERNLIELTEDDKIVAENWFDAIEEKDFMFVDWSSLFRHFSPEFSKDLISSISYEPLRRKYAIMFHQAVAHAALEFVKYGIKRTASKNIVLSGGTFMNKILTEAVTALISADTSLKVHTHELIPPNDGGISLGQIFLAGRTINA